MERSPSGRPGDGEFAAYAKKDIEAVKGDDAVEALLSQANDVGRVLEQVSEAVAQGLTYAIGKWTLKQVIGHMLDDERIFAYRILCLARNDQRSLPGFDENEYMAFSDFESRPLASLLSEYSTVRAATVALLQSFSEEVWQRKGMVNGYEASVRGLAFHIAGHELHHLQIIRVRYLKILP